MKILNELENILNIENIFSIEGESKKKIHKRFFNGLTQYHYKNCKEYKKILDILKFNKNKSYNLIDLPFLPVTLFKNIDLMTIKKQKIIKTMKSSGTTSNQLSKIYLDSDNSRNQIKALSNLFFSVTETKKRLPMLIIDTISVLKNRNTFSARAAAIKGFSFFSSDVSYALNNNMTINYEVVQKFLKKYGDKKNIIFGFTSILWKNICENIEINSNKYNFKNSIILHGGGWKTLKKMNISNSKFEERLFTKINSKKIINYYGMIEQTGSIFFQCTKCKNFVTSVFSDIIIRDKNFKDLGADKIGLVQLLSVLPTSYPGHNILTEDLGMIINKKKSKCDHGDNKIFKIFGRLKKSDVRGCSDAIN